MGPQGGAHPKVLGVSDLAAIVSSGADFALKVCPALYLSWMSLIEGSGE